MSAKLDGIMVDIKGMSEQLKVNFEKLSGGNKAAGQRARVLTLDIEKKFKEFRKLSVEESKN